MERANENVNSGGDRGVNARNEKNYQLFLRQKKLLDTFLGNGAITKAQYDKSLGDLMRKTGFTDNGEQ